MGKRERGKKESVCDKVSEIIVEGIISDRVVKWIGIFEGTRLVLSFYRKRAIYFALFKFSFNYIFFFLINSLLFILY